jgi:hypothetical protein
MDRTARFDRSPRRFQGSTIAPRRARPSSTDSSASRELAALRKARVAYKLSASGEQVTALILEYFPSVGATQSDIAPRLTPIDVGARPTEVSQKASPVGNSGVAKRHPG